MRSRREEWRGHVTWPAGTRAPRRPARGNSPAAYAGIYKAALGHLGNISEIDVQLFSSENKKISLKSERPTLRTFHESFPGKSEQKVSNLIVKSFKNNIYEIFFRSEKKL